MKWIALVLSLIVIAGCDELGSAQKSASGVSQASVRVKTDAEGFSVEQKNIIDRLTIDNSPGSIKHLYIISAYSGDVLIYSTVRGKVTSSGKRVSPTSSYAGDVGANVYRPLDGGNVWTTEVIQDDGTYGSSIEYLFWFDSRGIYHQHYPAGGQIIHVSDQPLSVPKVILNLEQSE